MARASLSPQDAEYIKKKAGAAAADLYTIGRLGLGIPEYDRVLDRVREASYELNVAGDARVLTRAADLYEAMADLATKMSRKSR
jgi:hypothetical protein